MISKDDGITKKSDPNIRAANKRMAHFDKAKEETLKHIFYILL
jgi:hypothetical protein